LVLSVACSSSEDCTGAACDTGGDDTGQECTDYVDANACVEAGTCPEDVDAGITTVTSLATRPDANPEIVDFVPGTADRAVVISSLANQLSELIYTDSTLEFGREKVIVTGSDTSNMTSVKVAPSGEYAAITVAEEDCVPGRVVFVDVSDDFGAVLGELTVGYGPDSGAFAKDGSAYVVVNEDDREDHPCKPADRKGGSVTIIDLSAGPSAPEALQTIMVDHDLAAEPEGVAISKDGVVLITMQETSEVGFFSLGDVPDATIERVALSAGAEPDGVTFSEDGELAVVGLERGDALAVLDVASRTVLNEYVIRGSGDVPDSYNRDDREATLVHEPEGVVVFHQQGQLFAGVALQESSAVLLYKLGADGSLTFDSVAQAGINVAAESGGREKGTIGTEGLAVNESAGILIAANEREGSITLFKTAQTAACEAP
jgi:hypothetical protein